MKNGVFWLVLFFFTVIFTGCGSGGGDTGAKADGNTPQEVIVDTTPIPSSGDRVLAVESMGAGKWRLTLDGTGIEDPFFRGQSSLEEGVYWKAYPVTKDPNFPGKLFVEVSWTNGFPFEFVFGTIGQWGQERNVVPTGKYAYPLESPDRFRVALTGNGAAADTVLGIEDKGSGEYWITLDFTPNNDLMASAYVTGLLGPNSDIWTSYLVEDLGNNQGRIKVFWPDPGGVFRCKIGKMIPGPDNLKKFFTPIGKYAVGDEIVIELPLT